MSAMFPEQVGGVRFQRGGHRNWHASHLLANEKVEGLFYAGDFMTGPKTVVEATASGKNAALEIDAWLQKKDKPEISSVSSQLSVMASAISNNAQTDGFQVTS